MAFVEVWGECAWPAAPLPSLAAWFLVCGNRLTILGQASAALCLPFLVRPEVFHRVAVVDMAFARDGSVRMRVSCVVLVMVNCGRVFCCGIVRAIEGNSVLN